MPIPCTGVLLFFPPNNFGAIKQCTSFTIPARSALSFSVPPPSSRMLSIPLISKICHQLFKVYLTFFHPDSRRYPRLSHVTVLFFCYFFVLFPSCISHDCPVLFCTSYDLAVKRYPKTAVAYYSDRTFPSFYPDIQHRIIRKYSPDTGHNTPYTGAAYAALPVGPVLL